VSRVPSARPGMYTSPLADRDQFVHRRSVSLRCAGTSCPPSGSGNARAPRIRGAPVAGIVAGIGLRTAARGHGVTVLRTLMSLAAVAAELGIRKALRSNGDRGLVIRWRLRRRTHGDGLGGCLG
jgi:hypothetical protein